MNQKQKGFAVVELIVVVVVIALLGGIGYYVYQKQNKKETTTQPTSTSTSTSTQKATWQKGDFAVKGKYADADIVAIDDKTWRLYYATQPEVQGHNFEVYSATSTDGVTWKEEQGFRKTMATFPDVVKLRDGRYRMYYQNAGVIKSAISTDGLKFTDEAGTRVGKDNPASLTFDNVAAPTVTQLTDGTFVMVYRGSINQRFAANAPNAATQLLMWATSTDGLTFTQKGIAIDSRNTQLDGQLDGPDLVKWDDNKYRIFMTSYTGVYEATFDGKTFGTPALAFAGEAKETNMGFQGAPPGDPTLAKIKGTWYMYYGDTGANSGIHYATYK